MPSPDEITAKIAEARRLRGSFTWSPGVCVVCDRKIPEGYDRCVLHNRRGARAR